jgi:hypothetical protein
MNSILAFWFAYVVTRPLGASFADWLGVSSARGGLAIGTGLVSFVLAAMIAMFVAFLTSTGLDLPADQKASAPADEDMAETRAPALPVPPAPSTIGPSAGE